MRQLTFVKPGQLEFHEVPRPRVAAETDALVRPLAVGRCDLDLDIAIGGGSRGRVFPGPFAIGHEAVGIVTDAGERAGVVPGDTVVVSFQLSCGRCQHCVRGFTNACSVYPPRAAYGLKPSSGTEFGGAIAELMHVPFADHMLVKVPDTEKFEITVDASGNPDVLPFAFASTAANGTLSLVSMYFGEATPVPLERMYAKSMKLAPKIVFSNDWGS